MRQALSDLIPKTHRGHQQDPADDQADTHEYPDGQAPGPRPAAADGSAAGADDAAADSRDARR
jgi:hypothetical protein